MTVKLKSVPNIPCTYMVVLIAIFKLEKNVLRLYNVLCMGHSIGIYTLIIVDNGNYIPIIIDDNW